ncbi:hypothetical protein B0H14DRAFT_3710171, partial [Mycena olivaceomarginata]
MAPVHRAKQAPSTAQHDNEERGSYASNREWKWATFRRDGYCTALATVYVHASITCQHPPRLTQERHLPQFPPAVARPTPLLDSSGTRAMATGLLALRGTELVQMNSCPECRRHALKTRAISTRARGGDDVLTRVYSKNLSTSTMPSAKRLKSPANIAKLCRTGISALNQFN